MGGMWVNLIRWVKYLTGSRNSVRFLIMFWVYCPFSHFDEWLAQKPFEMNAIKLAHPFWCWLFYDLGVTAEFQKKKTWVFSLIAVIVRTYIFRFFLKCLFPHFYWEQVIEKIARKFFGCGIAYSIGTNYWSESWRHHYENVTIWN